MENVELIEIEEYLLDLSKDKPKNLKLLFKLDFKELDKKGIEEVNLKVEI